MKKIITLTLALLLVLSMAVPAYAVTPDLQPPDLPDVPDISGSVNVELPDKVFDDWFAEHPVTIKPEKIPAPGADLHRVELQPISFPSWWEWLVNKYT